jgi:hypothetical protein
VGEWVSGWVNKLEMCGHSYLSHMKIERCGSHYIEVLDGGHLADATISCTWLGLGIGLGMGLTSEIWTSEVYFRNDIYVYICICMYMRTYTLVSARVH